MKYPVVRDIGYDFRGESGSRAYPNLHRYPATMLPQIGVKLLKDFDAKGDSLLDPYCGSGSSFASGLACGFSRMAGFDINPLAVLISKAKFTRVLPQTLTRAKTALRAAVYEFLKDERAADKIPLPTVTNRDYWFSDEVLRAAAVAHYHINKIKPAAVKNFFLVPFSETVREASYTRNGEFKLYRMKREDIANFNPDVIGLFFCKLDAAIAAYTNSYFPLLTKKPEIRLERSIFAGGQSAGKYDVVLTSPPYGDSRTTVAYGQFSALANEWLGFKNARRLDGALMGGKKAAALCDSAAVADHVRAIAQKDRERALDVSGFYSDLRRSICGVAAAIKKGGSVFYVVGNRTVKGVELPSDQFIAEEFESCGLSHVATVKRALSNKTMPLKNSPSNKSGKTASTMLFEHIVVCKKRKQ